MWVSLAGWKYGRAAGMCESLATRQHTSYCWNAIYLTCFMICGPDATGTHFNNLMSKLNYVEINLNYVIEAFFVLNVHFQNSPLI